jgi:hypothetical protein
MLLKADRWGLVTFPCFKVTTPAPRREPPDSDKMSDRVHHLVVLKAHPQCLVAKLQAILQDRQMRRRNRTDGVPSAMFSASRLIGNCVGVSALYVFGHSTSASGAVDMCDEHTSLGRSDTPSCARWRSVRREAKTLL